MRPRRKWIIILLPSLIVLMIVLLLLPKKSQDLSFLAELEVPDWVDVQLIDINGTARSGTKLDGLQNIVIHYVGNPNTTAQQNHDYFAQTTTNVSAHFLVGLGGEIIQCIPLNEKSAASNHRNHDTISIEVCHPDETGKFTDETYRALVRLCAWLCSNCSLSAEDLIRHYDVTGKLCPIYYVNNQDAWDTLKADVTLYLTESK